MSDTIELASLESKHAGAVPPRRGVQSRVVGRLLLLVAAFAAAVWTLFDLDQHLQRVASAEAAGRETLARQRGQAHKLAGEAVRAQQVKIADAYRFLGVIAGLSSLPAMEGTTCTELLRKQLINEPHYSNVGVATKTGHVLCHALPVPASLYGSVLPREGAMLVPEWPFADGGARDALLIVTPIVDNQTYLGSVFTALDPAQLLGLAQAPGAVHRAIVSINGAVASNSTLALPRLTFASDGTLIEAPGASGAQRIYGFAKLIDAMPALYTTVGLPAVTPPLPPNDEVYARAALLVLLVAVATYLAGFGRDAFLYNLASGFAAALRRGAKGSAAALQRRGADSATKGAAFPETEQRSQTKIELRLANEALKKALDQFEQRDREMAILNELGRHLQTCSHVAEIQAIVEQFAQELFPDMAGALFMLSTASGMVEAQRSWGMLGTQKSEFAAEDCWALRLGKAHRVDGPSASLQCAHVADEPLGGYVCTPLIAHGEVLGMLHLQGQPPLTWSSDSAPNVAPRIELAQDFAERVALALTNLRLRETLRVQSIRDVLTGLYNRRFLEESMAIEEQRAQRSGAPVGIVMLDIDHFKRFNDTFGHDAGDALLRELGSFLRAQVREGDTACRYGGEEFTLILPGADIDSCRQRAEALRRGVASLTVTYHGRPLGPITLSIGVASFPQHGRSWRDVLKAADRALYRAKSGGRNRVLLA